ncbi:MAG: hypothetical protein V1767_00740 [Chloroflexota bacterium]
MEFKLVIQVKDTKAIIGISAPDADPIFQTAEGNIPEILGTAAELIETAQEKWKTVKKNPTIDLPKPVTPPAPAAPITSTSSKTKTSGKTGKTTPAPAAKQESMF